MVNKNPSIIIKSDSKGPCSHINWEPYLGKDVDVVYRRKQDIVVPQLVTSLDLIFSEDEHLGNLVNDFMLRAQARMGPFYKLAEAGRWIIRGSRDYTSDIFTSYSINSIKPKDALPSLAKTVKEALSKESEEKLKSLLLMHTHPKSNTPISSGDYQTLKTLAEKIDMEKDDLIQIMAIPINDNGRLIFRCDLRI